MWEEVVLEGVTQETIENCGKTKFELLEWLENIIDEMLESNWDEIVVTMNSCETNNEVFAPAFWHYDLPLITCMYGISGPKNWISFLRREMNRRCFLWNFCNHSRSNFDHETLKQKFLKQTHILLVKQK